MKYNAIFFYIRRLSGVNGRITVNGQARDMRVFKKLSSYIMQDDILQPRLTVNESLKIAAELKLGSELGKAEKALVVSVPQFFFY